MPISALPAHLRINDSMAIGRGTDWDNIIQGYIPQGWFAFGPNADDKWSWITLFTLPYWFRMERVKIWKFNVSVPAPRRWFPVVLPIPVKARWRRFPLLLLGFGVMRWKSKEDEQTIKFIDMEHRFSTSLFGGEAKMRKAIVETKGDDKLTVAMLPQTYFGPSPIQNWSPVSFQVTWPLHVAVQVQWNWSKVMQSYKKKVFFRAGCRWDSLDDYHVAPSVFFGFTFN